MTAFDQHRQDVDTQYNAGHDIILVNPGDKRVDHRTGIELFCEPLGFFVRLESMWRDIECIVNSTHGTYTVHLPPGRWSFLPLKPGTCYYLTLQLPDGIAPAIKMGVANLSVELAEGERARYSYLANKSVLYPGRVTRLV